MDIRGISSAARGTSVSISSSYDDDFGYASSSSSLSSLDSSGERTTNRYLLGASLVTMPIKHKNL